MNWGLIILVSVWVLILVLLWMFRNRVEATIDPHKDEDDFLL